MLNIIHKDHKNIMQLLLLVEDNINLLKDEQEIDYQLIKSITSYLKKYADKYHHPMENLIYAHYLKYRVVEDKVANRLVDEHKNLKLITADIDEMLDMIMLDAIIPKELIIEKLSGFLSLQRQHLMYEETEVLPQIAQTLTEDDWAHLNLQWQHKKYEDPLFGKKISEQYKALSESIYQS
ncbi:hemerythrin domain-containing protein [Psychromonas aquatilis]|uniref:Hemerythrin domain-containing protein n=1 Tax=Psychromonas aquatilis TaxID=2005072 RepID=A0ABU9GPT0_9GAMM